MLLLRCGSIQRCKYRTLTDCATGALIQRYRKKFSCGLPSFSLPCKVTFLLFLRLLDTIIPSLFYSHSSFVCFCVGTVLVSPNTYPHGLFAFGLPVQSHRMCTENTNCRDKLVLCVHDWSRAKYLNFRCLQRDFSLTFAFMRKIIKHYHYFRSELYCFWSKAVVRFTKSNLRKIIKIKAIQN